MVPSVLRNFMQQLPKMAPTLQRIKSKRSFDLDQDGKVDFEDFKKVLERV